MINHFLLTIYNSSAEPVQSPLVTHGPIVMDFAGYTPYATPGELGVFTTALYSGMTDYQRLGLALQLVRITESSTFAPKVRGVDPRVSYTAAQADAHIRASGVGRLQSAVTTAVASTNMRALLGDTRYIYWESAVSEIERAAALAVFLSEQYV